MTEHVRIRHDQDILAITLARPERRNALTVAMYAALADAIEGVGSESTVRIVTISGEGQDFCAGNDLADFLQALPRDTSDIPVWRLLRALVNCEVPIVAAVHGNCVGIGSTMLLHCDLVVADPQARFSLPFIDLGLVPEAGSSLLLPQLAGRRRAARYLLLGESFGTEEALDIGLVSHLAAAGDLGNAFAGIVDRLRAKPSEALAKTHRLLREGTRARILERMELENRAFAERLESREAKDAISAFFAARSRA